MASRCTRATIRIHVWDSHPQTPSPDHSPEGCVSHTLLGNVTLHGLNVEQCHNTPSSGGKGCTKFGESFGGRFYGINSSDATSSNFGVTLHSRHSLYTRAGPNSLARSQPRGMRIPHSTRQCNYPWARCVAGKSYSLLWY